MRFDPGFDIQPMREPIGFCFGRDVFRPEVELRHLDAIRPSLMQPDCEGPQTVYAIAMDTGRVSDRPQMQAMNLLFGVVTYAAGRLGREPIRSQGHIHAVSQSCGMSTCELYEIWEGKACIYMQETANDDPGRCFAVLADPGSVVLVPPGWAHCTISADAGTPLTFGAWCVRDYGFDYRQVRAHNGLAWFPVLGDSLDFERNSAYLPSKLCVKRPRRYEEFDLCSDKPIYTQFVERPERFRFVPEPQTALDEAGRSKWERFVP